ncbi:MAG TPA: hypothetical protein PLV08_11400 [Flavobacteriales bacterium]|nr:hypothetical protein [Flavobacteriales bacterium]MBP8877197.1 hypothetical protein [Flavobacteriales bacterium]HQW04604.1 hypothetical protein [Flavobacteriales bacterium]HQY00371.1 hypothetical protein [Flavobacteriales bacterium]
MADLQLLYTNLGYLFYSVAASDGIVRPSEVEKLKALIKAQWLPMESSRDALGTDAAHYIDIAFDYANTEGMTADAAFARFEAHLRANSEHYDKGLCRMIRQSAGAIASAYSGRNKSEVRQLASLELLFREYGVG